MLATTRIRMTLEVEVGIIADPEAMQTRTGGPPEVVGCMVPIGADDTLTGLIRREFERRWRAGEPFVLMPLGPAAAGETP